MPQDSSDFSDDSQDQGLFDSENRKDQSTRDFFNLAEESEWPDELTHYGRYRIIGRLGRGGFGEVFRAHDPRLDREVAIKVPRTDRAKSGEYWRQFIDEGRAIARLNHPSIISVFDVELAENVPFVVMELVDGKSLGQYIRESNLSYLAIIGILSDIANGLIYAHKNSIVHRDIKPSNILIDADGKARITDFGLALTDNLSLRELGTHRAGTPSYMAPEQVRGENHLLDGRTDIWSFGVVMYWMLTGQTPFRGETVEEVMDAIQCRDPKPPRQQNEKIPGELERICLRCISKLMRDRYQSAAELVEDLQVARDNLGSKSAHELTATPSQPTPVPADPSRASSSTTSTDIKVVPKGLRSFGAGDSDFFLDLLPGPKDRDGIPRALRFWLESFSIPGNSLPVGMIYGPSGSGKSSFVKAGLIPRLPASIEAIYVESSREATESQLGRKLEAQYGLRYTKPDDLAEFAYRIRSGKLLGENRKLLLVFDQFEQWLTHNEISLDSPLIQTLRQCDGVHVAALILVRDEFWILSQKLFEQLDETHREGENALAMPLFGRKHAIKVLKAYGQAFQAFQADGVRKTEKTFIEEAVNNLLIGDHVICAHLALLAEMLKGRDWTTSELRSVGGWEGIGSRFLEEALNGPTTAPRVKAHSKHIQRVLGALLPDQDMDIKGSAKTEIILAQSTDTEIDSQEFSETINILEKEVRLITAVDPTSGQLSSESQSESSIRSFQLSHDILVKPVENYLTELSNESWRERARIRLEELATKWKRNKDSRYVPNLLEYFRFNFAVRPADRSLEQRELMNASRKRTFVFLGVVLAILVAISSGLIWWSSANRKAIANERIQNLIESDPRAVSTSLQLLEPYETPAVALARQQLKSKQGADRLRLLFLIAKFSNPAEIPVDQLLDEIASANSKECANFIEALRRASQHPETGSKLISQLSGKANDPSNPANARSRFAIVQMHLGNSGSASRLLQFSDVPDVRTAFIQSYEHWRGDAAELVSILEQSEDAALVSGLLKSLARIDGSEVNGTSQNKLLPVCQELYSRLGGHPAVFAAAESVIRKWNVKNLPKLDKQTTKTRVVRNAGSENIVLVPVPAQKITFDESSISPGFNVQITRNTKKLSDISSDMDMLMMNKEVSRTLFHDFLKQRDEKHAVHQLQDCPQPTGKDMPANSVSWYAAALFCNWLSDQHGLERYYKPTDLDKLEKLPRFGTSTIEWEVNEQANGYRLPTMQLLELGCRSGAKTAFHFGHAKRYPILNEYAVLSQEFPRPSPRATKLPNDYGLFDTLGNVDEWCQDCFTAMHSSRPAFKGYRGGAFTSTLLECWCGSRVRSANARVIYANLGFRVVVPRDAFNPSANQEKKSAKP